MNKAQFLTQLKNHLQEIPEKDRNELIEDYVSHFEFGMQDGKSEEDIVRELGSPEELAFDAINEFKRTQEVTPKIAVKAPSSKTPRTIFSIIGLFLLNFVCAVIPLFLSIWAAWLSLFVAFAIGVLSPVAAIIDFSLYSYFSPSKLFASLVMSGISIFAVYGVVYIGKFLARVTMSYIKWNMKIIKGAE